MPTPQPASRLSGVLIPLGDEFYKADLELLDRYVAFSSEIVRLSLAVFGGLGLTIGWILKDGRVAPNSQYDTFLLAMLWATIMLSFSTAFALGHRFVASDGIYRHLRAIKHLSLLKSGETPPADPNGIRASATADETHRNGRFAFSGMLLLSASICLVLGVVSAGTAVGAVLIGAWNGCLR